MSDAQTITCPECGSAQRADAPFCDNCGFRLGRPETSDVGLADTEVERPAVRPSDLSGAKTIDDSAVASRAVETEIEGFEAIPKEMDHRGLSETTFNEGVVPPSAAVPTEPGNPAVSSDPNEPYSSGLYTAPVLQSESRSRVVLWAVLWVVSVVAVAMGAFYFARSQAPGTENPDEERIVEHAVVEVPAGSFPRGLSESTRAFILRTCLKSADDRSQCDQQKLLAGEYPQESVSLEAFGIDDSEVTVGQWEQCVVAGDCQPIDFKNCRVYTHQGLQISLRVPRSLQQSTVAATCVSRDEAAAYCGWAGGRLPTHDEWERAARGTEDRLFPWGASWDPTLANWGEADVARVPVVGKIDGFAWVAPPGQYPDGKSPAGLFDVAGNVAEWVADEPVAARGGAWTSNPFDLRTTGRLALEAGDRRTDVGFRCAYDR